MRGYAVHLIFHVLAVVIGAACGFAAGLWWFEVGPTALVVFFGTLLLGVVLLLAQAFYIRGVRGVRDSESVQPGSVAPRRGSAAGSNPPTRTGTRPDLSTNRW